MGHCHPCLLVQTCAVIATVSCIQFASEASALQDVSYCVNKRDSLHGKVVRVTGNCRSAGVHKLTMCVECAETELPQVADC